MLSPLRNRFGIPGVISVIALVFAMLGGAYAASNNGGGKATASAKAKRGPRGPKGATGPAGPVGPQGAAGANGKDGASGSNGTNGANGKDGQSVTGTPIAAGGACGLTTTGVKYTLGATSTNVCNGEDGEEGEEGKSVEAFPIDPGPGDTQCDEQGGAEYEVEGSAPTVICNGKEGSPWTAGGTLPPGKTETGAWAFSGTSADSGGVFVPISYSIPLAKSVGEEEAHFEGEASFAASCPGTRSVPLAESGQLCIYRGALIDATFAEVRDLAGITFMGAGKTGAVLKFTIPASPGVGHGWGSFAVTAKP